MTLQLIEGFEDGIVANAIPGKWAISGSIGVSAANGRHGSGAKGTAANSGLSRRVEAHQALILGAAFRFDSLATHLGNTYRTISFYGDGGATQHLLINVHPTVFAMYRGGTRLPDIPHSMTTGTWYYVEVKVVLSDTAGAIVFRVDGVEIGRFDGDTRNAGTNPTLDTVELWQYQTGTLYTTWAADDIYIANGAGTVDNDFLGDHRVDLVLPNGNGFYSQLLGSDGNNVDNYLLVDENPPDTLDYVGSATDGNKDTYLFGDAPAGRTISGVQTTQVSAKTDTGAKSMRQLARIGGVDYAGIADALKTAYHARVRTMGVSPATGADWTEAEFNGAEFGVEVQP